MRRATITIPDRLERAIESYRRDAEVPPALASLVQSALTEYLSERGYFEEDKGVDDEWIPSSGGKPKGRREGAPRLAPGAASEAVIEDRR